MAGRHPARHVSRLTGALSRTGRREGKAGTSARIPFCSVAPRVSRLLTTACGQRTRPALAGQPGPSHKAHT